MDPGALLPDIGDFHHVRIQTRSLCSFAERGLMHARGAGAHHNSGQSFFLYGVLDHKLAGFRAHVGIIRCKNNVWFFPNGSCNLTYIHSSRNVASAPTDKNSYFLQILPFLSFVTCCTF